MADPAPGPFKYRAFLSYRTSDARQAAWLHRTLERYQLPRDLVGTVGDFGPLPRKLGTVYRDRDESRSAEDIETVIAHELSQSEHLIVLCTPAAVARESWVPREIELFRQRRPGGPVHAVIGAGTPPACFPAALLRERADGRVDAPFAPDIRPVRRGGVDGPDKGAIRLIAGVLGVPFDRLWQRERRRRRWRRLILATQLTAAAVVAWGLVLGAGFYRTHATLDVELGGIDELTERVELVATEEAPERNESRVVVRQTVSSGHARLWIPTSNLVVRLDAAYRDGAERSLAIHVVVPAGWRLAGKRLEWTLPRASEIAAHAGMAYVPATAWFRGRDNDATNQTAPFWIDIRPPTMAEYLPVARRLAAEGHLPEDISRTLMAIRQQRAASATGLDQLPSLNKDLGAILGVIAQASSSTVAAPGDIVAGLVTLPCDTCPALMTRPEADIYCRSRGMRLATMSEWELAVRGVDGRVYPWGNRFDATRANVPGLPQKGEPAAALRPVNAYAAQRSPFGLIDTVGNAGDWVDTEGGYDRAYMGATYRYNPEDATAFRLLPVTDSDYLFQEITARCVDPVKRR
jgi:hypothetical protein